MPLKTPRGADRKVQDKHGEGGKGEDCQFVNVAEMYPENKISNSISFAETRISTDTRFFLRVILGRRPNLLVVGAGKRKSLESVFPREGCFFSFFPGPNSRWAKWSDE